MIFKWLNQSAEWTWARMYSPKTVFGMFRSADDLAEWMSCAYLVWYFVGSGVRTPLLLVCAGSRPASTCSPYPGHHHLCLHHHRCELSDLGLSCLVSVVCVWVYVCVCICMCTCVWILWFRQKMMVLFHVIYFCLPFEIFNSKLWSVCLSNWYSQTDLIF